MNLKFQKKNYVILFRKENGIQVEFHWAYKKNNYILV